MDTASRNYLTLTAAYWAFTVTDGAIRMLVVLHFHHLGYSPFEVAMLFLFYEFFGVVTNLAGGWVGARLGLDRTLLGGMALQVVALALLTVPDAWLTVPWVMFAQALSGIAKDLNKMSAKASVKHLTGAEEQGRLFRWVALLTGSKNALKGAGFFIGAALLQSVGFRGALWTLAGMLTGVLWITARRLPRGTGRMKAKPRFHHLLSRVAAVNRLSAARFFLFGSRDLWFVVGLPVYLYDVLGWRFTQVGAFMALWVIGYGLVQAATPGLLRRRHRGRGPGGRDARRLASALAVVPAAIALALAHGGPPAWVVTLGLAGYGLVFALNSAVHSYLVLAYASRDGVALDVGFYYMANAGGRLTGTLLSGWAYQSWGLVGCLWLSAAFVTAAALLSLGLPDPDRN